jgi:NADH-quinone oxidoreductase subunit K
MHPVIPYVVAAVLFGLGCYGVLVRRNAVLLLMAVELMLNAVNLVLVTADTTVKARLPHTGGVFAMFVIVLAAAEIGVGLAIVLQLYRLRRSVQLDEIRLTEPDVALSGLLESDDGGSSAGAGRVPAQRGDAAVGASAEPVDGPGEVAR